MKRKASPAPPSQPLLLADDNNVDLVTVEIEAGPESKNKVILTFIIFNLFFK